MKLHTVLRPDATSPPALWDRRRRTCLSWRWARVGHNTRPAPSRRQSQSCHHRWVRAMACHGLRAGGSPPQGRALPTRARRDATQAGKLTARQGRRFGLALDKDWWLAGGKRAADGGWIVGGGLAAAVPVQVQRQETRSTDERGSAVWALRGMVEGLRQANGRQDPADPGLRQGAASNGTIPPRTGTRNARPRAKTDEEMGIWRISVGDGLAMSNAVTGSTPPPRPRGKGGGLGYGKRTK